MYYDYEPMDFSTIAVQFKTYTQIPAPYKNKENEHVEHKVNKLQAIKRRIIPFNLSVYQQRLRHRMASCKGYCPLVELNIAKLQSLQLVQTNMHEGKF